MRKHLLSKTGGWLTALALTGLALCMLSCLNPIGFSPTVSLVGNFTVDGSLDTRDITAASTYIVNMSKSLDFLNVTITQKENEKLATATPQYLVSRFDNTKDAAGHWKIVKTKYVQASDIEYEVALDIQTRPGGSFKFQKSADVYATQSKGIYYVWLYRTKDQAYIDDQIAAGVPGEIADIVVVSPNDPNAHRPFPVPDAGDTNVNIDINVGNSDSAAIVDVLQKIANAIININGNTSEKTPEEENGSVPPVISPKNRTQMGTFLVVNLSRTRNIDWVQFVDEGRKVPVTSGTQPNVTHTINSVSVTPDSGPTVSFPAVAAQDRRSIALLQGEYKIQAGHNGTEKTSYKTATIVPSNDPQTVIEHYMYFYKDRSGNYVISTEKPGEWGMDPNDALPPSTGNGVGRITLINRTTKAVLESVTLQARDYPARGDLTLNYSQFVRHAPVGVNGVDDVDVIGSAAFPVDGYFIASVKALTADGITAVTRLIYLNNTIAEIIITDNDIDPQKVPGARVTVNNGTTLTSIVHSVTISDSSANSRLFTTNVVNGSSLTFDVFNSIGMPIIENALYTAEVYVTVTKQFTGTYMIDGLERVDPALQNSGSVTVAISPDGKLYGKNGPASCPRTISITDFDITSLIPDPGAPVPPVPAFVPATDIIITNGEYQADDSIKFFANDGTARTLSWLVIPSNATNQTGEWAFGQTDSNVPGSYGLGDGTAKQDAFGRLTVKTAWTHDYLYIAYIIPYGKADGVRSATTQSYDNMTNLVYDAATDFVRVFKLRSPPPATPPITPPTTNRANIVLTYTGKNANAGTINSFNLIEVYQRPDRVTYSSAQNYGPANPRVLITPPADPYGRGTIVDPGKAYGRNPIDEKGQLLNGKYTTGRTGWWWEEHSCDEFNDRFGSQTEGWVRGYSHGVADSLWQYQPGSTATGSYKSVGMGWWGNAATPNATHRHHYSGRSEPWFLGSVWFGNAGDPKDPHKDQRSDIIARSNAAGVKGVWNTTGNNDGRFNNSGERIVITVPTDKGPLWLRLRTDHYDSHGFDWKACTALEWFVYDPATNYAKDANGNVLIDVYAPSTPHMKYR